MTYIGRTDVFKRLRILICAVVLLAPAPALHAAAYDAGTPKKTAAKRGDMPPYSFGFETGIGYDSNAYLSPDRPYTDFATASNPTVTPAVRSGFYLPMRIKAAYEGDSASRTRFLASYRFSDYTYWQAATDNADR